MARAESVARPEEEEVSPVLQDADNGMLLLITRGMWDTLLLQARAEKLTPGTILSKALKEYLERHGSQEAVDYLFSLAERRD